MFSVFEIMQTHELKNKAGETDLLDIGAVPSQKFRNQKLLLKEKKIQVRVAELCFHFTYK